MSWWPRPNLFKAYKSMHIFLKTKLLLWKIQTLYKGVKKANSNSRNVSVC